MEVLSISVIYTQFISPDWLAILYSSKEVSKLREDNIMQRKQVIISRRSHTVENLYKSLKLSWKCFTFSLVSIGSLISSIGTICCHPCGVTRMGPEEVPAVFASTTFGCCCCVPTTSPAVISRAFGRLVLVGGVA
jgi:hypothetical protein